MSSRLPNSYPRVGQHIGWRTRHCDESANASMTAAVATEVAELLCSWSVVLVLQLCFWILRLSYVSYFFVGSCFAPLLAVQRHQPAGPCGTSPPNRTTQPHHDTTTPHTHKTKTTTNHNQQQQSRPPFPTPPAHFAVVLSSLSSHAVAVASVRCPLCVGVRVVGFKVTNERTENRSGNEWESE